MRYILPAIVALVFLIPVVALSQSKPLSQDPIVYADSFVEQPFLVSYGGYYDFNLKDDTALQFGMEYRFAPTNMGLRPAMGFNVSNDGDVYLYGGVFWDIELIESKAFVIPSFVLGSFIQGHGKDIGGPLQFRTGIEFAYQFENGHRIGLGFHHMSNGNISNVNPGAETVLITYHIPVGAGFAD